MKPQMPLGSQGRFRLLLLILLFLLLWQCSGADDGLPMAPGAGPDLHIKSISGKLELGRPSSIFVVLENRAEPSGLSEAGDDPAFRAEAARGVVAELTSPGGKIAVLSGPQMAGLLAGGESTVLQFSALAEGLPLGIYPFSVRCNYSRLSEVAASGVDGAPSLVFEYERPSVEFPLKVEIAEGPRVEIEEKEVWWGGSVRAGDESGLRLWASNLGEEAAEELDIQVLPKPPFLMVENMWSASSIAPGEGATLSLNVFTDENASAGCYALPCIISYRVGPGGDIRREEKAALVYVKDRSASIWVYPAAALFVLFLAAILLAAGRASGRRRRIRIVKS
ncbi:MAG: hypothetical protein ACP5OU_07055 [Methanothrix sp.]